MQKNYFILHCLSFLFISLNSAFGIIIDDFSGEGLLESSNMEESVFYHSNLTIPALNKQHAVGGSRKISLESYSLNNNLKSRVVFFNNKLFHSQDSSVSGITRITWDGGQNQDSLEHKLNLDLLADKSSMFTLDVLKYDAPWFKETGLKATGSDELGLDASEELINSKSQISSNGISIEVILYNGNQSAFSLVKNLSSSVDSKKQLEFPFSEFKLINVPSENQQKSSSAGEAINLHSVSAIELLIHGVEEATDLELGLFSTNQCAVLPNLANQVVDKCGVCNGDNSSCLDCQGIVNGTSQLDRCGVCNGNGNSCLTCESFSQSNNLTTADSAFVSQLAFIRKLAEIARSHAHNYYKEEVALSYINSLLEDAEFGKNNAWRLVWSLPSSVLECQSSPFCETTSLRDVYLSLKEIAYNNKLIVSKFIKGIKQLSTVSYNYDLAEVKNEQLFQEIVSDLGVLNYQKTICN